MAGRGQAVEPGNEKETARIEQIGEIVALIQRYSKRINQAKVSSEKFRIAVLAARAVTCSIAEACARQEFPFAPSNWKSSLPPRSSRRARLGPRPAQSPGRVAWLGVLRAPWSGLSLDDLHCLPATTIPRCCLALAGVDGRTASAAQRRRRRAAARALQTYAAASALRAAQQRLAGNLAGEGLAACGRRGLRGLGARANSICLALPRPASQWRTGPVGPVLLRRSTSSQPSPPRGQQRLRRAVDDHPQIQRLEFEVVIVPELQAGNGRGKPRMLSWLERGLAEPDESGEITEFLIAPFQRKGADRGKAKEWVDRVYRERESQETRRILYVAPHAPVRSCTCLPVPRARGKRDFTLVEPVNSLLAQHGRRLKRRFAGALKTGKPQEPLRRPRSQESRPSPLPARAICS